MTDYEVIKEIEVLREFAAGIRADLRRYIDKNPMDNFAVSLKEEVEKMSLKEKMAATRKHREGEYEKLIDAVYPKRGWNLNGVPTIAHLKELGMDLPELLEVVEPLQ